MVFVLDRYYGFSRPHIAEAVHGLMQLSQINCNRTLFEKALVTYANHTSLSFEDCCLAVYAELNDAEPLWTFDKKLAHQVAQTKYIDS